MKVEQKFMIGNDKVELVLTKDNLKLYEVEGGGVIYVVLGSIVVAEFSADCAQNTGILNWKEIK